LKLYEKLADDIERTIDNAVLQAGDRVPSIRQTSQQRGLSITTVLHAYLLLESRGRIESRPQSGYFVRAAPAEPTSGPLAISEPAAGSTEVDVSRLVLSTLKSIRSRRAVPLGSPYPDPSLFPWRRINRYANVIARRYDTWDVMDDIPPGNPEMIRQIARRYLENGLAVDPSEVVVTVGATEAINLCLQAIAKPGDTIAVESPTFYAMLHAIERMGMRAIEVPTHPNEGIDLGALAKTIEEHDVAACMVMPNFQNPLGFRMPDEKKRELVGLMTRRDLPLIENGVYDELYYGDAHPGALKAYDTKGLVLHCSSFSKWLTAGVRIGWALPGRYRSQVEKLKFLNTLATPSLPQLAIAEYLKNDGVEHHLRRVRQTLAQQARILRAAVQRFFPSGTKLSQPQGGYVLWVELPTDIDSMVLYHQALERGITIGPGRMFSTSNTYSRFIRLNYSYAWSRAFESAVIALGKMVAAFPAR
jgi:DNA-binding transcriptional MocR family regulator